MSIDKINIPEKADNPNKKALLARLGVPQDESLSAQEINRLVGKTNELVEKTNELDQKFDAYKPVNAFNFKENVATYADLASIVDPQKDDAYGVLADGLIYIYNGESWPTEGNGLDLKLRPTGTVAEGVQEAVSGDSVYSSLFPWKYTGTASFAKSLIKSIVKLELAGNFYNKLITMTTFQINRDTNEIVIVLSSPNSVDEEINPSVSRIIARNVSTLTSLTGVQRLPLNTYADLQNYHISGYITIDFDKVGTTGSLQTDYVANTRLFDQKAIHDLNGGLETIEFLDSKTSLIVGKKSVKKDLLNATIKEINIYEQIQAGKRLIISTLSYSSDLKSITIYINQSDDDFSTGTLVASGTALIPDSKLVTIELNGFAPSRVANYSGYVIVDLNNYVANNTDAAITSDNATYKDRGINLNQITSAKKESPLFSIDNGIFAKTADFKKNVLLSHIIKQGFKIFIKGTFDELPTLAISTLRWTLVSDKYRLVYQIKRKTSSESDFMSAGLVVFTGSIDFDTIEDIKGIKEVEISSVNSFGHDAVLELNLDYLPYNNTLNSMYFANTADATFSEFQMDIEKVLRLSKAKFSSSGGGVNTYDTLHDAMMQAENGLFSVGSNLFKSIKGVPSDIEDFVCISQVEHSPSANIKEKIYVIEYNGQVVRLETIDNDDNFYFQSSGFVLKSPHIFKQELELLEENTGVGLILFDGDNYYQVPIVQVLFTNVELGVDTIRNFRLTEDNELLFYTIHNDIINIIITDDNQLTLRNMTINGVSSDRFIFGEGVAFQIDWCYSQYGNVCFLADYDSGVDNGNYPYKERGTTGGQKCYRSTDGGYTWETIFEFYPTDGVWSNVTNPSNITAYHRPQAHIHGVHYDWKQDVVWIITGDGAVHADNSSLFYSTDLGQTWTHMRSTVANTGARTQLVNAINFNGCVVFGTDASNVNGVTRVTYNQGIYKQEIAKNFFQGETGLFVFARNTWNRDYNSPTYISFGKEASKAADLNVKSFIAGSTNGYKWHKVWEDSTGLSFGNTFCFDDSSGNLYVTLDGNSSVKNKIVVLKNNKWR